MNNGHRDRNEEAKDMYPSVDVIYPGVVYMRGSLLDGKISLYYPDHDSITACKKMIRLGRKPEDAYNDGSSDLFNIISRWSDPPTSGCHTRGPSKNW